MRRIVLAATALMLVATLSACSGASPSVQRNDYFSGMTLSMPIGAAFK